LADKDTFRLKAASKPSQGFPHLNFQTRSENTWAQVAGTQRQIQKIGGRAATTDSTVTGAVKETCEPDLNDRGMITETFAGWTQAS